MKKVSKINNPYFQRDYILDNGNVTWLETGVWCLMWEEQVLVGFKYQTQIKKKVFATKQEALSFQEGLFAYFLV